MARPTIRDLAQAAGVSVATVNRVLAGADGVRPATRMVVQDAAARIGFYGLGAIEARVAAARPRHRLGVLLLQPHRPFYRNVADALRRAAAAVTDADIDLRIDFVEDLSPQTTAAKALAMAETCTAMCITAAVHPVVTEAITAIQARGVHVFALVAQLSATGDIPYIGLDNWKVGRTAAWTFAHVCKIPGKIGVLIGSPRFRNQEMNEAGFRSFFREHDRAFVLLEPLPTYESAAVAQEMTERLLSDHPDLVGLYVSGGGISGALSALRTSGRAGKIVVVGYDLMDVTRAALLDGTMTLVISHPLERLARDAVSAMLRTVSRPPGQSNFTSIVPFDIHVRENL